MNESDILEEQIKREALLKEYEGPDRVVHAQDKFDQIAEEVKNRPKFSAKMGLPTLDICTDGFRTGQLVVLSGPPKNGKTLLCQNLTTRFTAQGHRCQWFEYELNHEEFLSKFTAVGRDFYIPNQMATRDLEWVEERIIEAKQKFGTDVVFIDHLDFLRNSKSVRNVSINMSTYVGGVVQKVKEIAVDHNVLIFLMTHIRKNEWTSGKLPSSEELRDSGQIAQLADVVMMIMRKRNKVGTSDEVYLENDAIIGVIENRHNGKTKIVQAQVVEGEFYETNDQRLNQPQQDDLL